MNYTAKKMSKIIDEMTGFFLRMGADDIQMELRKLSEGFQLKITSNYLPGQRERLEDLNRFLTVKEKDEGLEEFFWQVAGVSSFGSDSEIHLIGQMIDQAEVQIGERTVAVTLFKKFDHPRG